MKSINSITACLFIVQSQLVAGDVSLTGNCETLNDAENTASSGQRPGCNNESLANDSPIDYEIFYGLNESHSRNWVQTNGDRVIGITYFQQFEGSSDEGTLIYKTINLDGSGDVDSVTTGQRLEKSVLLYDSLFSPHIFVARSDDLDQVIDHHYKNDFDKWQSETITHFNNLGGRFIYELSADTGPDHSFHLLILKTRSDIDSDDYWNAWINSYLYHMTNSNGTWQRQLIHNYDMAYTYDHYIKSSGRQDIKVDNDGYVHVTFSQQINASDDPSRLLYATNKSGTWDIEVALNNDYGPRDDAGWFPSLCLDNDGVPHISCMYVNRVHTYSAVYCKLLLLKRLGSNNWQCEVIAEHDDGYYGTDGRNFTGALSHLVFDDENTPHLVFSDIASSHWGYQRLNVGNIRYGVFRDGDWEIKTIYRQPLPTGFLSATEMHGMCLVVSELTDTIRVIGEELEITSAFQYTSNLLDFSWAKVPADNTNVRGEYGNSVPDQYYLSQNYPNPFNPGTWIEFYLPRRSNVAISIYNLLGQQINTLVSRELTAGSHSVYWNGADCHGSTVSSGIYFYRFRSDDYVETKKMLLLK
ncbi:MAG TPA: T9SS type A sorting domain-containing protein [Acidobacteriota bacterium]|nr:T9SS type A sorting domain-containing protein [Acidobacteriota bacterium]